MIMIYKFTLLYILFEEKFVGEDFYVCHQ